MTNIEKVNESLRRRGRATISQVIEDFPDLSRDQVMKALQNSAARSLIHASGYEIEVFGQYKRRVGVYAAGPKPERAPEAPRNGWPFGRVASVWGLGQGVTV